MAPGSPELTARRKAACDYISSVTDCIVPEGALRAALRDGVLLAQLANAVVPGAIDMILLPRDVEDGPVGLVRQRQHNLGRFLAAVQHLLPVDCALSLGDLEDGDDTASPRITDCVLALRDAAATAARARSAGASPSHHHQQQQREGASPPRRGSLLGTVLRSSPGSPLRPAASSSPCTSPAAAATMATTGASAGSEPGTPPAIGGGVGPLFGGQAGGSGGSTALPPGPGLSAFYAWAGGGRPSAIDVTRSASFGAGGFAGGGGFINGTSGGVDSRRRASLSSAPEAFMEMAAAAARGSPVMFAPGDANGQSSFKAFQQLSPPQQQQQQQQQQYHAQPFQPQPFEPLAEPDQQQQAQQHLFQQQQQHPYHQQQHYAPMYSGGGSGGGSPVSRASRLGGSYPAGPGSCSGSQAPHGMAGVPPLAPSLPPHIPSSAAGSGYMGGPQGAGASGLPVRSDSRASMAGSGVTGVTGVTRLMQQCSTMLRDRMYASGGVGGSQVGMRSSFSAVPAYDPQEVLFPVIDSMLGQITQEYEKRLQVKDHDISAARDRAAAAAREAGELRREVEDLRERLLQAEADRDREAAAAKAAAAKAAEAAATSAADASRSDLEAARAALAAAEAELAALRGAADAGAARCAERDAELEAELEEARRALADSEDAVSRYRSLVEANRALYNEVQDLKGGIRVFCRVRPTGVTGDSSFSCVAVNDDEDVVALYNPARDDHKAFRVNRVFDEDSSQESVYADTQPLVRSVLDGYNVCIFAYGQTGSGKTHTMSGTDQRAPEGRGINYRALEDLFGIREERKGQVEYSITVQMLEIYNETLRDLLADRAEAGARLEILSTMASGCNVPGATQVEVGAPGDVARLMARGAANRATSETKMNDHSSRSHQILTVVVDGYSRLTGARTHGCLHLIDLAGSERVAKSEAAGDRLVEAQHINRSLSALGDVIAALAARSAHVPFRNSKLTQLLQDSLSGAAKVMMFMHISPEASSYSESVSTLNFAKRVSEVTLGQAKRNIESGRIFRANEALAAARCAAAQAREELGAAQEAAEAYRRDAARQAVAREAAEREARELRAQLDAARREVSALSQRQAEAQQAAHQQAHVLAELRHQVHQHEVSHRAAATRLSPGHPPSATTSPSAAGATPPSAAAADHSGWGTHASPAAAAAAASGGGGASAGPTPVSGGVGAKVTRLPLDHPTGRDQNGSTPRYLRPPRLSTGSDAASTAAARTRSLTPPSGTKPAAGGGPARLRSVTPPSARMVARGVNGSGPRGRNVTPPSSIRPRGRDITPPSSIRPHSRDVTPPSSFGGRGRDVTPPSATAGRRSSISSATVGVAPSYGTPRAAGTTPRALSAGRGSASAQRHADRLQAARLRAAGVLISPSAAPGSAASEAPPLPPAGAPGAGATPRAGALRSAGRGSGALTARAAGGAVRGDDAAAAKAFASASARPSGTWGSRPASSGNACAAGAAGDVSAEPSEGDLGAAMMASLAV